jgi:parvulin-like peptidyl-prolyl isomerase
MTDQVLELYFKAHRRDFDGTELRVSQILLASSAGDVVTTLKPKADEIRNEVIAGKLTFADAAKKYSTSPTGKDGGDLGFIPRHDVMSEDFSQAAFALKKGEISQPLVTTFGVHLITVTDVRPGTKTWSDVRKELRNAAAKDLFDKIVAAERLRAKIEYDPGAVPLSPRPSTKP